MAQNIIDIGAVPDDGQGDPLRTAFDFTNLNFNQIFAAGPVLSNIQIGNNTITTTVLNSNLILSPSGIGRVQLNNTLFPRIDDVYSVGTPSLRFNSVYIGTGGIDATGGITTTANITAAYFIGNGSQLTGIVATAGGKIENGNSNISIPSAGSNIFVTVNSTSNVVTFANTGVYVAGIVSATGNVSGTYLLGNGAFITGLPAGYSNADVANYLPTYSGNLPNLTGLVSTTGNVAGNYFIGNGSLLTGVTASAVNADALVGNTLSSNVLFSSLTSVGNLANLNVTGNAAVGNVLTSGVVSAAGNISGNYILGNGALLTGVITSVANINNGTSNVTVVSSGGNVSVGVGGTANVAVFATSGEYITGLLSASGNITGGNVLTGGLISSTGNISGNYFIGNGSQLTGVAASSVDANALIGNTLSSNVLYSSLTQVGTLANLTVTGNTTGGNILTGGLISATSTITSAANIVGGNLLTGGLVSVTGNATVGNLSTAGLLTASGNITGGNILSNNYYYANGTPVPPGIIYTANTAPPVSPAPKVTDQWYDTANDVLYEYLYDGTSNYWIDTTSPAFAGGVVANVAISGTLLPIANVSYDVGNSTAYFRNTYTQNLYTNNRLPAYNMPVGAVVQTVMSSSLGGSTTNSGSYADISYANVTITPSSSTSKVLVIATGTSSFTSVVGQDISADTQLVRSPSTSLQIQTVGATGVGATGAVSYSYMDSPGTTSPVNYKLQQKVSNTSSTLTSTNIWLIAMEIAAS